MRDSSSDFPREWAKCRLSDVILPFDTVEPTKAPTVEFTYVDIGSIDNALKSVSQPKTFLGKDAPSRARRSIRTGDVLFSTVRPYLRNIAKVPDDLDGALTSTGICVLRPSPIVDPDYLFHWVLRDDFISRMSRASDGTLYPAVSDTEVGAAEIVIPPLPEQRRIVAKIDALSARSRRARADLDRVEALAARAKQAVLHRAYSGDLTENWRAVGGLSSPSLVGLDEVCLSVSDGDHQAPPKAAQGVPFITISAMNSGALDLRSATRFVPQSYFNELKSHRKAVPGDILYSVTGSIGIAAPVDADANFVFQRHIALLRPNIARVDRRYLLAMLRSPQVREQAVEVATGTAQLTIPLTSLREFTIPLPCLDEQLEVVRRVEFATGAIKRAVSDSIAAARLLDRLDQSLLAKAFRGELVPQDPDDEPASVLLDRIRAERAEADPPKRRGRPARQPR